MTRLTYTPTADPCDHCPSSQAGCAARQQFAKGERCCRRCTHDPPDNECPPSNANNASMGRFFSTDKPRTTPCLGVQPPRALN